MKTLILGLVAMCSMSLAFAQTNPTKEISNPSSVSFIGVNIAGNVDDFLQKIEDKGYTMSSKSQGDVYALKGIFMGQAADVLVLSTEKTEQVYAVIVLLPKYNNWHALKTGFKALKKSFVEQFGKPDKSTHYFTLPFDDVQDEMEKVQLGRCKYACSWTTPKVGLEITKDARIMVTYENDTSFQLYAGL